MLPWHEKAHHFNSLTATTLPDQNVHFSSFAVFTYFLNISLKCCVLSLQAVKKRRADVHLVLVSPESLRSQFRGQSESRI